ncbi:anti-sigma factor family protein [Streptomyces sp. NPDC101151]|uniref:anti-sigma factor family protein n=1 Tax=Streptomyces sp. NPDC101151 TaxID=3366115 RepID=UPI0038085FC2
MTSSTDTAGHPDVAEISDLTEGLLPPDRSADVRRHLEECELCADAHASLEEIRGLLGAVPAPPRMPADIVGRIDAALAAEALPAAASPEALDVPVLVSGSDDADGEDTGGRVSRETSVPSDRPAGRPHASTGPGRKGRERGRRRRSVVLGAVLTAAFLGAGSLVLQSLGSDGSDRAAPGTSSASATAFSGDSVQSQVKGLLATKKDTHRGSDSGRPRSGVDSEQNSPASTQSANTLIQTQPSVPDCVRQAINGGDDVLGAKTGTYAGKSAYLVVLPDADDTTRVTAYVVDAACVHQQPASAGKVLLKQSFSRS